MSLLVECVYNISHLVVVGSEGGGLADHHGAEDEGLGHLEHDLVLDALGVDQVAAVEHAAAVREEGDGLREPEHDPAHVGAHVRGAVRRRQGLHHRHHDPYHHRCHDPHLLVFRHEVLLLPEAGHGPDVGDGLHRELGGVLQRFLFYVVMTDQDPVLEH